MSTSLGQFLAIQPTLANRWRAIILFGRNSATYKFALAKALLEIGARENDLVTTEELARPFAEHVCNHLGLAHRQGTNPSSKFLDACKKHMAGELDQEAFNEATIRFGFENVIDAFHNLGGVDNDTRFFVDDRKAKKGIRITEEFQRLVRDAAATDLSREVEARWRLVETAWSVGLNVPLIEHESNLGRLFAVSKVGRTDVTSCRDALNGYQKGHCFYCSRVISVTSGRPDLAHVDHFIPFALLPILHTNLNGVWNLVLACQECNLSKSDAVPSADLAKRLFQRNEFLIISHHPLRETLMAQTGYDSRSRADFVGRQYADALQYRVVTWGPKDKGEIFL